LRRIRTESEIESEVIKRTIPLGTIPTKIWRSRAEALELKRIFCCCWWFCCLEEIRELKRTIRLESASTSIGTGEPSSKQLLVGINIHCADKEKHRKGGKLHSIFQPAEREVLQSTSFDN
jgi:hypothetical protein